MLYMTRHINIRLLTPLAMALLLAAGTALAQAGSADKGTTTKPEPVAEMETPANVPPAARAGGNRAGGNRAGGNRAGSNRAGNRAAGQQFWQRADIDQSGTLTLEELQTIAPNLTPERFALADTDGNGELSRDEARTALQRQGGNRNAGMQRRAQLRERFLAADTNGDMQLSLEEFMTAFPNPGANRFRQMDRNGDGMLGGADRQRKGGAAQRGAAGGRAAGRGAGGAGYPGVMRLVRQADADEDGAATYEEVQAVKPGFPRATFDRADRNGDGKLSADDAGAAARPVPDGRTGEGGWNLMRMDADGDGRVSREEANGLPHMDDAKFAARDCDGDGYLTRGECGPQGGPFGDPETSAE